MIEKFGKGLRSIDLGNAPSSGLLGGLEGDLPPPIDPGGGSFRLPLDDASLHDQRGQPVYPQLGPLLDDGLHLVPLGDTLGEVKDQGGRSRPGCDCQNLRDQGSTLFRQNPRSIPVLTFIDKIDRLADTDPEDVQEVMDEVTRYNNLFIVDLVSLNKIDRQSGLEDIFDLLEEPAPRGPDLFR
jgi:hypothetical protein